MSDSAMNVIKWAWVHGSLNAYTFETLEDAVSSAHWASDYGEESLQSIEVIGDDGAITLYDSDAVDALMEPLRRREDEAYRARPTPTVILDLRGPSGDWGAYSSFVDRADAEVEAAKFRIFLGAERVALRPYGQPRR